MSRPFYRRRTKANIRKDIEWLSNTYDIPLERIPRNARRDRLLQELNRLETHENRTGSFYMITIQFKYRIESDNRDIDIKGQPITSFTTKTKNPSRELLLSKAYQASMDYARSRTALLYEPEILDVNILNVEKINNIRTLADIPTYKAKLDYPNLKFFDYDKDQANEFSCGFSMLMNQYPKKTKKHNLEKFFKKSRMDGLTPNEILEFCKFINVSCYIVDMNYQEIVKYVSTSGNTKTNRETQALIASVASNHYYLITNKDVRTKIVNQVITKSSKHITGQNVMQVKDKTIEKQDELIKQLPKKLIPNTHYYLETDKLNPIYLNYLNQGLAYSAKWNHDHITSIFLEDGIRIHGNPQYKDTKQACEDFDIKFNNHTPQKLARKLWREFSDKRWTESTLSPDVQQLLINNKDLLKGSAFNYTYNFHELKPNEK
jgi:hypothetical protein